MLQNDAGQGRVFLARGRCSVFILCAKHVLMAGLSTSAHSERWMIALLARPAFLFFDRAGVKNSVVILLC